MCLFTAVVTAMHSSLLSRLAHQGLQTMFQPQAGAQVPLYSCSHCQHSSLLSTWHIRKLITSYSLRLVPMCLFTAVVADMHSSLLSS